MEETIVLFPSPGISHIISMVELGKLILHNYPNKFSSITILICTGYLETPALDNYIKSITNSFPSISFRRFPVELLDAASQKNRNGVSIMAEFNERNPDNLRSAIQEISQTFTVKALVIGLFCVSAVSVGSQLGIPTYYFFTSGVNALAVFLYFPKFFEQSTDESLNNLKVLDCPGMSTVRTSDLMGLTPRFFLYFCVGYAKATGIIINSFEGFEPVAMKALEDGLCVPDGPTPPVFYIGPLIGGGVEKDKAVSEEEDYMTWLDEQPSRSVVFLCFGSRGTFSVKQVREIAIGLENSGKRFLWVIKKPVIDEKIKQTRELTDFDLDSVLPEGFTERTREVGRVVKSWVSQAEVLKKKSVGGFVTHCGWNSILEAVVLAGVPMIAWPLYAEQHLNRNSLVEDMGMAIPVEMREEDGFVSGTELEKRIRELMDSEKGKQLREQNRKMKEMSLAAFGETGSSKLALKSFIDAID